MNKLLLTAYGFSTDKIKRAALGLLNIEHSSKACIISTSKPEEKEKHPQMQQIRNDLLEFRLDQVDFLDVEFESAKKLYGYDLIFLNGGYPFYLLHFLKKSGADHILKDISRTGVPIFGLSAGSIVMGPSIEYLQYLYPEDNQFNDTDLTGLNLTSTTIFPHFKEMLTRDADIDKKLTSYGNTTGVKIMRLNNDQALSCHCKDKVLID